jgi:hypothetical protein
MRSWRRLIRRLAGRRQSAASRAHQSVGTNPVPPRATERIAEPGQERVGRPPRGDIRFGEVPCLFQLAISEGTFRFQGHRVDGEVCAHLLAPLLHLLAVPVECAGHVCIMGRRRAPDTVRITGSHYGFRLRFGVRELRGEALLPREETGLWPTLTVARAVRHDP